MGSSYPLYHTSYETFELVKQFIDSDFKAAKTLANVVAQIVYTMASNEILPFNTNTYAQVMQNEFNMFKQLYQEKFTEYKIDLSGLEFAFNNFTLVSQEFMKRLNNLNE